MKGFYEHINNIPIEDEEVLLMEKAVSDETLPVCKKFVKFCKDFLDLKSPTKITFVTDLEGEMTTGGYHPGKRSIDIYSQDRALVDVLRSIAHELVHQKQHDDDRLRHDSGETGSDHENEANALAGILMRHFQKENRDIY
jgi:hypothetical protein